MLKDDNLRASVVYMLKKSLENLHHFDNFFFHFEKFNEEN